jgi:hypothetical protein
MTRIMAESYKISAAPTLYTQGEYKGKLKGVTFTATSANDSRQWFAKNCGQFERVFTKIMPADLAEATVTTLAHGDAIDLPGVYQDYQFEQGFLFEWSPVYLVLPPIFFHAKEPA